MSFTAGADLVAKAKDGDRAAFDELIGPLVEQGYRLAYGMLHNPEIAEDAVQEAAVRSWRKLGNLHPGTEMRPWFLAIVANQCRTFMRGRWWRIVSLDALATTSSQDVEDEVVRGADVRSALRRLSAAQREVIVLHFYLDLPLHEVAAVCGVPVGTVKSRLNRGLAAMRPFFVAAEVAHG